MGSNLLRNQIEQTEPIYEDCVRRQKVVDKFGKKLKKGYTSPILLSDLFDKG
jgi:hypothetical protein